MLCCSHTHSRPWDGQLGLNHLPFNVNAWILLTHVTACSILCQQLMMTCIRHFRMLIIYVLYVDLMIGSMYSWLAHQFPKPRIHIATWHCNACVLSQSWQIQCCHVNSKTGTYYCCAVQQHCFQHVWCTWPHHLDALGIQGLVECT